MQFSAIRQYAATRFRDPAFTIVTDTDWKNYVNDAYEDMLTRMPNYPWNENTTNLTFPAGTRGVTLPVDAWIVSSVWDQTNQFPLIPLEGRDQVYQEYPQQTETGQAMHFRLFNNQLQVYPLPQTQTIYVVEFSKKPADMVADADLPVFPAQYHTTIVEGAVALAYRDDGNLPMSQQYSAQFEMEIKAMMVDLMQPRNPRFYEPLDMAL